MVGTRDREPAFPGSPAPTARRASARQEAGSTGRDGTRRTPCPARRHRTRRCAPPRLMRVPPAWLSAERPSAITRDERHRPGGDPRRGPGPFTDRGYTAHPDDPDHRAGRGGARHRLRPADRVRIRAGTQNNYSGAGADGRADALVAAPNGGYLRRVSGKGQLHSVRRSRARPPQAGEPERRLPTVSDGPKVTEVPADGIALLAPHYRRPPASGQAESGALPRTGAGAR
jgi:hypothetical protein